MTAKRKRVVLSVQDKLSIINRLESGQSPVSLANEHGIGVQTVRDFARNKDRLLEYVFNMDSKAGPSKRKAMKKSTFAELDDAMYNWHVQKRREGAAITGPMYVKQAKHFQEMLGLKGEFNASTGWLTRFKNRHGISDERAEGSAFRQTIPNWSFISREVERFQNIWGDYQMDTMNEEHEKYSCGSNLNTSQTNKSVEDFLDVVIKEEKKSEGDFSTFENAKRNTYSEIDIKEEPLLEKATAEKSTKIESLCQYINYQLKLITNDQILNQVENDIRSIFAGLRANSTHVKVGPC